MGKGGVIMIEKIQNIVMMSNHLNQENQSQQRQLKSELKETRQEIINRIDREVNRIDLHI